MRDAVIRIQELDGTWQTLGTDRASGITAEGLQLTSNEWGPDTASFELHRDPSVGWPDLSAFTPVEVEVGNQLCWSGRIAETQIQDGSQRQLSVRCEGWQYHLDDDQLAKSWVSRSLTDWKNITDYAPVSSEFIHEGTVDINEGNIWIGWKAGTTPKQGQILSIVLDLGSTSAYDKFALYLTAKAHLESLVVPLNGLGSTAAGAATSNVINVSSVPSTCVSGALFTTTNGVGVPPNTRVVSVSGSGTTKSPYTVKLTQAVRVEQLQGVIFGENTGGYLTTTGIVANNGYLNTSGSGAYFVSGTAYKANEIVLYGNPALAYQANKAIPSGSRGVVPSANATDWNVINGPLWLYSGTATNETALTTFASSTASSTLANSSPSWGTSTQGAYNNNVWATADTSSSPQSKAIKDSAFLVQSFGASARYAHVTLKWSSNSATSPLANNYGYNISAITVYADQSTATGYPNSNNLTGVQTGIVSSLKASDVITDAIKTSAPKINVDGVQATSTSLQNFKTDGYRTPREVIESANSFHNWVARVNENQVFEFKPKPTVPVVEAGAWSGYEFTDQAASSGSDIYSRVIVDATGPDGQSIRAARTAAQLASNVQLTKAGASTLSADQQRLISTTLIDSTDAYISPAYGTVPTNPAVLALDGTGTFRAGVIYQFNFTIISGVTQTYSISTQASGTVTGSATLLSSGAACTTSVNSSNVLTVSSVAANQGIQVTMTWAPDEDVVLPTSAAVLNFSSTGAAISYVGSTYSGGLYTNALRDVTTKVIASTLAEKRGLRRTYSLNVPGTQTLPLLAAIGDAWLYDRLRSQFKGSVVLTGPTAIRQSTTGDPMHPSRLLLNAGDLIRLQDRIDPDTGSLGRDARIQSITYDHDAESVTLELDNRRENLQTFLNRLASQ